MPVHQFMHDHRLLDLGLRNYWGYNTFGFFAPHYQYAATHHAGAAVAEFKTMVRSFHEAGIEVILDVVYNHTAEGNHSRADDQLRGIDNAAYYRLLDGDLRLYKDFTGTGNSLNARHPHTLQLIMDSLRYWVLEMHVDGFRFDLASTLAREFYDVDRLSAFFDLVQQDPVVSQVKLIAEPWDVGEGGYQVGNFPGLWTEWNGKYRDTVRDYWRGEAATLGEFASRLTGSSDLYEDTGRRPSASINFVTCHDGFTLNDLVSYNEKHNLANGEGQPGRRKPQPVLELRCRGPHRRPGDPRAAASADAQHHGHPDGVAGHADDRPRRRDRANSARQQQLYCQDNELSWMDWSLRDTNAELLDFARKVTALRKHHPVFRRRRFFEGELDPQRRPGPGHRLADPGGHRDDAPTTGAPASSAWRCSSTARPSPRRTPAASGWWTTRSFCVSTRTTPSRSTSSPRRRLRRGMDRRPGHLATQRRHRSVDQGRREDHRRARSVLVLQRPPSGNKARYGLPRALHLSVCNCADHRAARHSPSPTRRSCSTI